MQDLTSMFPAQEFCSRAGVKMSRALLRQRLLLLDPIDEQIAQQRPASRE
jgi:hypothetical protein